MSGFVPWRWRAPSQPTGPAAEALEYRSDSGVRIENAELRALLGDRSKELLAAKAALADERRHGRALIDQLRAAGRMVAAAERECTETCAHARVAAERGVQLAAMQDRLDVLQAANERQESRGFVPRRDVAPYVPVQRRTT